MAVVSVAETYNSGASETVDERRARRVFLVRTDSKSDDAYTAQRGTGVPRKGDFFPGDSGMVCVSLNTEQQNDSPYVFEVTCEYSTRGFEPGDESDHPLDRPAAYNFSPNVTILPIYEDKDGNAIVNSSGVEFDPTVEREFFDLVVTVTRNESTFSPSNSLDYMGHVNSASWTVPGTNQTVDAKQALCTSISGTSQFYQGARYYEVTYEFLLREDTWTRRVVDQGMMRLAASGANLCYEVITDDNGNPVSEPVLLNGSGGVLTCGGTPVILTFDIYPEANFNSLNL